MNHKQSESSLSSMIADDDCCGDEMPCICCSGAYESFDSITSVMESRKKEESAKKIAEKATEKVTIKTAKKNCPCGQCSGRAVVECFENHTWKKYPLGSDEGTAQAVSGWQTLSEDGANANLPKTCELLRSGCASCRCAECCNAAIYDDNHCEGKDDDSVRSEDCLDELTITHI
jgi:hypothetical protein